MQRHIPALLLASTLLFAPTRARADTTQQNVAKYHALRARLVTDFVHVGTNPGDSQPADVRLEAQGFIKWADSTIRLGWYIGVLASELYLADHASEFPGAKGTEDTLNELYSALLAMERLDGKAESAFPECGGVDALNGFFLRDDVPAGFHSHFPPLTTTYSDFVDPTLTNKEESQDQVYHVLLGLALVKHLVPATVTKNGKVLRDWAAEQARRIVERMAATDWTIKNPACGDRTVARGSDARLYSGGTKLAIAFITDGAYSPAANGLLGGLWSSVPGGVGSTDIDNVHMASALAAVGDGWAPDTAKDLYDLSLAPGWPIYPILHRVLHTTESAPTWCATTGAPTNTSARKMLDELPAGADIASPRPGTATHQFTRSQRFERGAAEAYTGEVGSDGQRYDGLDYMLLHNLYAIATPSSWEGGSLFGAGLCATAATPDGGTSSSGGVDDGGASSSSSSSSSSSGGDQAAPSGGDGSGCGCGVVKSDIRSLALALFVGAGLFLRRRRRLGPG